MNDTSVTVGLFISVLYLSVDGFFLCMMTQFSGVFIFVLSVNECIYLFKLIQSVGAFIFALSSQSVL
jgi:hypothetical protein